MKAITPARTLRANRPTMQAMALCGAIGLLTGCVTQPESHVISAPPPTDPTSSVETRPATNTPMVVTAPSTAQSPAVSTVIVTQTPPVRQAVPIARPEQPSIGHIWVDGHWTWRNARYEWMPGHWELPPATGAQWVTPHWEREGNDYRFYEGYWRY